MTTGYANLWMVDFGELLDSTMQSPDVSNGIWPAMKSDDGKADDGLLVFDLQRYTFEERGAHFH